MRTTFHRVRLPAVLAIAVLCYPIPAGAAAPPREYYSILDLGTLGGEGSRASGINSTGQVVGWAITSSGDKHAFRTAPNRAINPITDDLGTLGGSSSVAWGINDAGQVVGYAYTLSGEQHAFRTAPNAPIHLVTGDLFTFGGPASVAEAINGLGAVVGYADKTNSSGGYCCFHAFRTVPDSPMDVSRDDVGEAIYGSSQAFNINRSGQVVGQFNTPSGVMHAFRTLPYRPIDPSTDDLNTFWPGASVAWGINNLGQVVGRSYPNARDTTYGQAFRTAANSPILSSSDILGTLGGASSTALSINDAGQVVGFADTASAGVHAFVWEDAQGMTDLNGLIPSCSGWTLVWATGINAAGQIVGRGFHDGLERAFLLTPAPVKLIGLEVTQTIQDWGNTVPSVEGKETWVRAHIQAMGTNKHVQVTARLHATDVLSRDLVPAVIDPLAPGLISATTNAADPAVRLVFTNTLNFLLPPQWCTGAVVLALETALGAPFPACGEPAELGGKPCDGQVMVEFLPAANLHVTFVPINFVDPGTNKSLHAISRVNLDSLVDRLRAIYPLARSWGLGDGATFNPVLTWTGVVPTVPGGSEVDSGAFLKLINERLTLFDAYATATSGSEELYYGLFKGPPWGGDCPEVPGRVASGSMSDNSGVYTHNQHAHELAHALGLYHPSDAIRRDCGPDCQLGPCDEAVPVTGGVWPVFPYFHTFPSGKTNAVIGPIDEGEDRLIVGLDATTSPPTVVDPWKHFEVMSYCGADAGVSEWISPVTYKGVWDAMRLRFPAAFKRAARGLAGPGQPWLLVRGRIDDGGETARFLPFGAVTRTVAPASPPPGEYSLKLLDGSGGIVIEVPFRPQSGSESLPGRANSGAFLIAVPSDPSIQRAVIFHGITPLASIRASLHAPEIHVLSPAGGDILAQGTATLLWQAGDADGDALTYAVLFSPDAGITWQTLAVDLTEPLFELGAEFLKGTAQGRIKVVASDGFRTAAAESAGLFTVAGHAPQVRIVQPQDGQRLGGAQRLTLAGEGRDMEEGYLEGMSLKWSSSLDGDLGNGDQVALPAAALSEGAHRITLVATDSSGLSATGSVQIVVSRLDPASVPALEIVATQGKPGRMLLSFSPAPIPRTYTPQFATNLASPAWSTLTTVSGPTTNNGRVTLVDTNAVGSRRFYRLLIGPP